MIGVAFQSLSQEEIENIGYVVPVNVINHFLDDVEKNGRYSGVCGLGVRLQGMENGDLRRHYKMSSDETGVLLIGTAPLAPSSKLLKTGDVILKIDDIRVANDGTIPFRKGSLKERVQLSYYITQKFATEFVELSILRDGERIKVSVQLWVPRKLVPRVLLQQKENIVGGSPSYLMVGGLVLIALSREYLQVEFNPEQMIEFDRWSEEYKVLALAESTSPSEGEEVVLLSQVLSNPCNIGYEMQRNTRLLSFNGNVVKNLKHLYSLIEKSEIDMTASANNHAGSSDEIKAPFVFEFSGGQVIVMDGKAAIEAREQICREHFISSPYSSDMKET